MADTTKSNDLRDVFVDMRKHKDSMQVLVELLEDEQDFTCYHSDINQYQTFCEAYTIALLEKYVRDLDVREPMLASYQLLDDYDRLKHVRDRRMRYSERAASTNKLISETWPDPNDNLQKIEDATIDKLVDQLIEDATSNKEKPEFLGLASIVVERLKKRFPNRLPKKLPLPKPRYKEQDATDERPIQSDSSHDSRQEGVTDQSEQIKTPEAHAHSKAIAASAAIVQNYVHVTVVASENTALGAEKRILTDTANKALSPSPTDNGASKEIDKKAVLPSGNDPANTEDQQNSCSTKKEQADAPAPSRSESKIPPSQPWWIPFLICIAALAIVGFTYMCFVHFGNTPSNENESLAPGEIYQSKYSPTTNYYLILTGEAAVESLIEYISSDPSLIEVSENGFLFVHEGQPGETGRDVEITAKDANGVIGTETFTIDFTKESYDPPVDNINDFVPSFTLSQQVRLVGSSEWGTTVDAKVGDKVEFWIQYRNTSDKTQSNVMIRDVLPQSLRYVAGTTKLWSADYDGAIHNENTITTTGFNIGHYGPNANAHVRFQAEVVEDGLACGGNVLGNWAQASVAGINMQNATVVNVNKSE